MELRDKLNTREGYQRIIDFNISTIVEEREDIKSLLEDEKQGIQRYPKNNLDIIQATKDDILEYQYQILRASYSIGEDVEKVKEIYTQTIEYMQGVWREQNGYIQMVWMLSIGIMLEIDQEKFNILVEMVEKSELDDYLVNFLISYRNPNWSKKANSFMFNNPYAFTKEIIELKDNPKQAFERLQQYLKKEWYKGHSDLGWYNGHKAKANLHKGYWSFESGAIAKILGLDDSNLKNQQYYPYDMVHFKG